MKKIILISITLLLSLYHATGLSKNNNCGSFTYKKSECEFTFPQSGKGIQSSEFSNEIYSGKALAFCDKGKYTIKKSICEEKEKNTCDYVSPTTWGENNISCSHETKELNLKEGERKRILSNENDGHITYECFNGRLQGIEQQCKKIKNLNSFTTKSVNQINECKYDNNNRFHYEYKSSDGDGHNGERTSERYNIILDGEKIKSGSGSLPTQVVHDNKIYKRGELKDSDTWAQGGQDVVVEGEDRYYEICSQEKEQTKCTNYNTASVSNITSGYRVTKCFVNDQSNSNIEGLCETTPETSVYDTHTSANANGGTTYKVDCLTKTPICPSNTTKVEIGNREMAEKSGIAPYYCDGNVCYYCKDTPQPEAELCSTCEMNSVTFSSNDNKNSSCNVDLGGEEVYSGDTKNKEFFNEVYHGQVSYFCMNGKSEVKSETCYLNCIAQDISWGDESDNDKSYYLGLDKSSACKERINREQKFKNKERSEVLTSTQNTGNAIFYCNGYNGEWVMEEERCKLDCPEVAYWPDNQQTNMKDNIKREKGYNPFNGNRKKFACSYDFGSSQEHGTKRTVSSNGLNKGTANLECKDGYWEVQGTPTCNLHCEGTTPSITIERNNRECKFNSDQVGSSVNDIFAHNSVVGAYSNDDIYNNGKIKWRCNDGEWQLESATCKPKTCSDNAYWDDSSNGCEDLSMSGTEGEITAATDTNFPSDGVGVTGYASFKCTGYSANDLEGKWVRTGAKQCLTTYNGKCGTFTSNISTPPSDAQACERHWTNHGKYSINIGTTGSGGNERYSWTCVGKPGYSDVSDASCSVHKIPKCGNDFYECDIGTSVNENKTNSTVAYWRCKNGSETTGICSKAKTNGTNGSCSTTTPETCNAGTFSDLADTGYEWKWRCNGSEIEPTRKAGSDATCSLDKPLCSNQFYSCSNGMKTGETTGDSTTAYWTCNKFGYNKTCDREKLNPLTIGTCGSAKNDCISGEFYDLADNDDYYRWKCLGSDQTRTRKKGRDSNICTKKKPIEKSGCELRSPAGWYQNGNHCIEYYLPPSGSITIKNMAYGETRTLSSGYCGTGTCNGTAKVTCKSNGSLEFSNERCEAGNID